MVRKSISVILTLVVTLAICVVQVAVFVTPLTIYSPSKLTVPVVLSNILPQLRSRPYCRRGFPSEVLSDGLLVSSLSRAAGASNYLDQQAIDLETGVATERRIEWHEAFIPRQVDFGDRSWLFYSPEESSSISTDEEKRNTTWEVVNGHPQKSNLQRIPNRIEPWMEYVPNQRFMLNGQPAYLFCVNDEFRVDRFDGQTWGHEFKIVLPDQSLLDDQDRELMSKFPRSHLKCLSIDDQFHVFLILQGKILYREGLEPRSVLEEAQSDKPTKGSAEVPRATDAGWSLIDTGADASKSFRSRSFACIVGGRPTIAILDARQDGASRLRIYRFDGSSWSPSETLSLPVNTHTGHIFNQPDGQRAYLLATTKSGWSHTFAIEPTGVRRTRCDLTYVDFKLPNLSQYLYAILSSSLVLGTALGIAVWGLMWWASNPEFQAAKETVKLASIGRRGVARGLDLSLLLLTAGLIGHLLLSNFDWYDFMEAVQSRIAHSTVDRMKLTAFLIFVWIVIWTFFQAALQAWSGRTLGKWCCGIRTMRVTLETLRFPRALMREILFYLDICYGLSFVPGILLIALTPKRQRIGDLLAGTIVVESRSVSVAGTGSE